MLLILVLFFSGGFYTCNAELGTILEEAEKLLVKLQEELEHLRSQVGGKVATYPESKYIHKSGIQTIKVPGLASFPVSCDTSLAGTGWLVIQRRVNGSLNFYRNWAEYQQGFGNLEGEFFLGLEKLRSITALEPHELYIHLEDFEGVIRYAKFDEFAIGSEEDKYALNVLGKYTGTAGDSLRSHYKMKWSTFDHDNDREFARNCAFWYVGAWWYNACVDSNLNGQYIEGGKYEENMIARGMCWRAWRGLNYGFKVTQMMIRPKCRTNLTTEKCELGTD